MSQLPIYKEDTPEQPGLYLGLYHGRKTIDEQLEDWGNNGPVIGPLEYVHTTYATHIKLKFKHAEDARKYGFNPDAMIDLDIQEDMVFYQDCWYGDWTVFVHSFNHLPALADIKLPGEKPHAQ